MVPIAWYAPGVATPAAILGTVALDRTAAVPLQAQLYAALRDAILAGRLGPGTRLPATRLLARDLDVGRNTVVAVFEQTFSNPPA